MTAPNPPITVINPSKSKTWVAAVGGLLTVIVPLVLSVSTYLPDPYPALIGGVVALLTAIGVYRAPYKPEGTSVVANSELNQVATPVLDGIPINAPVVPVNDQLPPTSGNWQDQDPWK